MRGRVMGIWSMVLSGAIRWGICWPARAADRWNVSLVLDLMGLGIASAAAVVLALALIWRGLRRSG